MRLVVLIAATWLAVATQPATAQAPAGSPPAAAGSAQGAPASVDAAPTPVAPLLPAAAPTAAELRRTCASAMNADPTFAESILAEVRREQAEALLAVEQKAHTAHAAAIAKNQRHVVMAYAALWLLAVAFVVFLWRRQARLRAELARLAEELARATK